MTAFDAQAARERAEQLARLFHETYERLAPEYGYETRSESAVPWEDVPEPNRSLMIAVASEIAAALDAQVTVLREALEKIASLVTDDPITDAAWHRRIAADALAAVPAPEEGAER